MNLLGSYVLTVEMYSNDVRTCCLCNRRFRHAFGCAPGQFPRVQNGMTSATNRVQPYQHVTQAVGAVFRIYCQPVRPGSGRQFRDRGIAKPDL